jgi:predicted RND superfamily exporter protein
VGCAWYAGCFPTRPVSTRTHPEQPRDLLTRFVALSSRRPVLVLAAFLAVGAGSTVVASRLAFRGSFVELLPESAQEVKDLHLVSAKAGGDGYLIIQAKGAAMARLRSYADAAAKALEALPEVRYVEYRYDIEFFRARGLMLLDAAKLASLRGDIAARLRYERLSHNPLYIGLEEPPPSFEALERKYAGPPRSEYIESRDGRELYLFVKPRGVAADLAYAQRLLDAVRERSGAVAARFPGVQVDFTGNFRNRLEEDQIMRRDLSRASLLSMIIAIGIILLATRRGSALIVVGMPVLLGIAVTFAVAQVTIGHLNIVTGFLMAILVGLGIEYGVHLAMRYWEERRTLEPRPALIAAVHGTFFGALVSALTNAAAFLVLVFARFNAFRQFGLIAAVGVMMTVLAAYGIGPAILALIERVRPVARPTDPGKERPAFRRLPTGLVAAIGMAVVMFAGYSAFAVRGLGFESDMRKLKGRSPSAELDDHVSASLGGMKTTPAILLVQSPEQARTVAALVETARLRHGSETAFGDAASLGDLLPSDLANRQREIDGLRRVLDREVPDAEKDDPTYARLRRMVDVKPWTRAELPVELRRRFESLDGHGEFVLLFPRRDLNDARALELWAAQIGELVASARERGIELAVLDGNLIAGRIFTIVKADGPRILLGAAAVVFLVILVALRSMRRALLVSGPLYLGMLCLAGSMKLLGVKLNFINCVVLPNVLAIAVDNAVHLFHRYEEEGPGSLGHVLRNTGVAAVVATVANAAGYGSLLIASHEGLRSIGTLAVLGVICTFMGTTVFFPAMMALLERWRARTATPTTSVAEGARRLSGAIRIAQ